MISLYLIILVLWIIAFILLRNHKNLWFSIFIIGLSLGYIVELFKVAIIPNAGVYGGYAGLIARFISAFGYRFCPYAFVRAGLSYAEFINTKTKNRLNGILLIPIFIAFIVDFIIPQHGFITQFIPRTKLFWVTAIWGVPYAFAALSLLAYAFHIEKRKNVRRNRLFILLLTLPTIPYTLVSYGSTLFGIQSMVAVNKYLAGLIILLFIYFIIRHGLLGLRLRISHQAMDSSIRAATISAGILNHALKNELMKISAGLDIIRAKDQTGNYEHITRNSKLSIERISHFITRTHKLTQLSITKSKNDIIAIIHESIASLESLFPEKQIAFLVSSKNSVLIHCDPLHIREVFENLFHNAIEAMESNPGTIQVNVIERMQKITIQIIDTGKGMTKEQLNHVFDPFYSTKFDFGQHLGLGLTYCFTIVELHNGSIRIDSLERQGSTVAVTLPK